MIDETLCWTIYQARNWSNWSRPMRFAITLLPMVVFMILGFRAFGWKDAPRIWIKWRDLRLLVFLLIPWAVSQILSIAYFALCYSP